MDTYIYIKLYIFRHLSLHKLFLQWCAFLVAGPREWNSLPVSVRQCTSVAQFKSKLKTHLFSLYYD